jgi:predicted DNA-binding transcriptional regulator AlpA
MAVAKPKPKFKPTDRLLSIPQVGVVLGKSERTVRKHLQKGWMEIPVVHTKGGLMIRESALNAWIDEHTVDAA